MILILVQIPRMEHMSKSYRILVITTLSTMLASCGYYIREIKFSATENQGWEILPGDSIYGSYGRFSCNDNTIKFGLWRLDTRETAFFVLGIPIWSIDNKKVDNYSYPKMTNHPFHLQVQYKTIHPFCQKNDLKLTIGNHDYYPAEATIWPNEKTHCMYSFELDMSDVSDHKAQFSPDLLGCEVPILNIEKRLSYWPDLRPVQ